MTMRHDHGKTFAVLFHDNLVHLGGATESLHAFLTVPLIMGFNSLNKLGLDARQVSAPMLSAIRAAIAVQALAWTISRVGSSYNIELTETVHR